MNFATLCSGIGAPEVAAHRLGMEPVFCSEIEPFPCAVLAHRWPGTPNYGDMTKWRDWPRHDLDLLIAGTPCQAFSVAGLRQGLDDARGNLTLEFARYADHVRPRFVLWENVPGVLSDKSNAFGCLLGGLAGADAPLLPRGGRWGNAGFVSGPRRQVAWRILDAQHFGVAQRRRRVWLLAGDIERGAGDWACARALFPEQGGVRGDTAQGGAAREEVAGASGGGSAFWDGGQVADTLDCSSLVKGQMMPEKRRFPCVITGDSPCPSSPSDSQTTASPAPTAENPGAKSADSTMPTASASAHTTPKSTGRLLKLTGNSIAIPMDEDGICHSLRGEGFDASEDGTGRGTPLVQAYDMRGNGDGENVNCLSGHHAGGVSDYTPAIVHWQQGGGEVEDNVSGALRANAEYSYQFARIQSTVRRLTPRECERLQGFPDDHTVVQYRNKPACDGPRYKALGNSMAVPCVQFILENLQKIDQEKA